MKLWGKTYTKREIAQHVGDLSQICGVRKTVLEDGPGRGMRCYEVATGAGLSFSVLPDRGMDLGWCSYKSIPIGFISKTGPVSPALCQYGGNLFLRGFMGGLLTTCGYTHMGAACVDEGEALGLHGRAGMLVADNTNCKGAWLGDDYHITLCGTLAEAAVFGENLQMTREIKVICGENRILLTDTLENCGFSAQPLMLLYHFNFGHPLVGRGAKLLTSRETTVQARDLEAEPGLPTCRSFEKPTPGYQEQVFYHAYEAAENPRVFAGIRNEELGVQAKLFFRLDELPKLIQWKQMGEGDYVCGLEPGTWYPEGRAKARSRQELAYLEPGEVRQFHLELQLEDVR